MGYATTISYLTAMAELVHRETGLLPHANPGVMTRDEVAALREVTISQGIMLESVSDRLSQKGQVHYGSPDKHPAPRLQTIRDAGELQVPFTSGVLIGIGETRRERIESFLALRELHEELGHIQEIIVQNFRAKPGTKMANAPEPDLDDLLWTIAVARIVFGPEMNIQAPPNLSYDEYPRLVAAGLNDWGGVSPVTPDHVNPEAPWPHLEALRDRTAECGKVLTERLAVYPAYALEGSRWQAPAMATAVIRAIDGDGFARVEDWSPGDAESPPPAADIPRKLAAGRTVDTSTPDVREILARADSGEELLPADLVRLFQARGDDYHLVCEAADRLRKRVNGDTVSYVVNRNINYTNICYFRCQFCAFAKGKMSESLRGTPYDLATEEVVRRSEEAWERGATEVCMQGGIHPEYTGETYLNILRAVKSALPDMHIHAFSPLEVSQGARRRSPRDAVPRQADDPGMAGRGRSSASHRIPDYLDHHVWPHRWPAQLGEAPGCPARPPEAHGRYHGVRATPLRAHGSSHLPKRAGAARPDLPRSGPHARGRATGAPPAHHEHPGVLGEDGRGRREGVSGRRRERHGRDAHEREYLACRRGDVRAGTAARRDGAHDPLHGTDAKATRDDLWSGARRPANRVIQRCPTQSPRANTGEEIRAETAGDSCVTH